MQKQCSICNQECKDFGSKQLWQGFCCRECAQKASPWLSEEDYKYKTVETFKQHLLYREENRKKLNGFRCNDCIEGKYSLYIDTHQRLFVISKRPDPIEDNADIFELDKIVNIFVSEEGYGGETGIDLFFEIRLKDSEINRIRFRLNEFGCIQKGSSQYEECMQLANQYKEHLLMPISGKEINMSEKQGRKKHIVDGTISEIKKSDEGLKSGQVGEKRNLSKVLGNLFKGRKK